MLDTTRLQEVAKTAFLKRIKEEVKWLAEDCWVSNLKSTTKKLNQLFAAANELNAAKITLFTEEEIEELANDLTPLRSLELIAEAHEHIVDVLFAHGVDYEIFRQPAEPASPEK